MKNDAISEEFDGADRSPSDPQLIAQLEFARHLVRTYFDHPDCIWEGRFHQTHQECGRCVDSGVCAWVFAQDPAPDLERYTQAQIIEALMFATGFLEGNMLEAGHETADCRCAICTFVRQNHQVINEH